MIPNTLLAVDGSARTFSWVMVIPSTGTTAGVAESERDVSVAGEGKVEDGEALTSHIVAVDIAALSGRAPHPAPSRRIRMGSKPIFAVRVGLIRRDGEDLDGSVFIIELRKGEIEILGNLVEHEHFFRCIVL